MALFVLRYDLRVPSFSAVSHAQQYAACLEQATWGDERGATSIVLSEHHGVDDGYLSSPLVMAGAVAGRTRRAMINISALLIPFHDPIRLAEDIAILDLASGGRVSLVAGLGYRQEEFDMAGIDRRRRGRMVEDHLRVMLQAWTGEPFEYQGRTVRVTPRPVTQPHPIVFVGGSTEIAARRAADLNLPFMPAIGDPALADLYYRACEEVGFSGGWVMLPSGPGFVHVTDDPERDWARIAPHALYDAQTYHSWQTPGQRSQVHVDAADIDTLRASGVYRVVTPDECVALADELGPTGALVFHPLMGGMPPELGWESLELFGSKVLPRLK
jgi:alkanesulfonate monooxygenase SsuD/methylene tetrahydromethanopterin reductase-like flavin-dependent oxidoreductase (luciferase family)